jgi:hypothetical protein
VLVSSNFRARRLTKAHGRAAEKLALALWLRFNSADKRGELMRTDDHPAVRPISHVRLD